VYVVVFLLGVTRKATFASAEKQVIVKSGDTLEWKTVDSFPPRCNFARAYFVALACQSPPTAFFARVASMAWDFDGSPTYKLMLIVPIRPLSVWGGQLLSREEVLRK